MKWVSFYGKDNRQDFWMCQVALLGLAFFLGLVLGGSADQEGADAFAKIILFLFFSMSMARRFRDMGVNPWWVVAALFPLVGLVLWLAAGFKPSASLTPNPHRRESDAEPTHQEGISKGNGWNE